MRSALISCVAAIALAGCDCGAGGADAGTDGAGCVPTSFAAGDPIGAPDPLGATAGQARAGVVSASQLPIDPRGLGTWRDGDMVLANSRVAAIVSVGMPRATYDPHSGRLVGLARVEGGALVEPADFGIVLLGFGRFVVATDSVTVIDDGTSGGSALVRANGVLAPTQALGNILETIVPADFAGLPAALEYEIAPDTDYVDVYLSVSTAERGIVSSLGVLAVFFQSYRMPAWVPGAGFGAHTVAPYLVFDGADQSSYAWVAPSGDLTSIFSGEGAEVFSTPRLGVSACSSERFGVGRIVIGGPGIAPVQAVVARANGTSLRRITGHVVESDGSVATGVRVHVTNGSEHLTRMLVDGSGAFDFEVDAGATQLWAYRGGRALAGPFAIVDGDNRIAMPESAQIEVTAHESGGAAMPARVEVFPASGDPSAPPESFGEPQPGAGRVLVDYPADGHSILRVDTGSWRVRVSRGPEYEVVDETTPTLADGGSFTLDAPLAHSVDTTAILCADYHIHSHRSVDSADEARRKVLGLIANGLEIAIRSEHEWVSDYQPLIESMGLADRARGLGGLELTTFLYGHFGVFPLEPDLGRPSDGAIAWYGRNAPDVFDEVRARPEAPALIINHPRAGGLRQGYFTEVGYDPITGDVAHPENWDTEFNVVEVFNDSNFEANREGTVVDWLSLLRSRHVFAVGSSDSHRIDTVPVGYPRTCLRLGTDDPRAITPEMVRDATVAGHSFVSGGIYLDVTGPNGKQPGETASGAGALARFDVVVQAASWIDVDRLEVIVDGVSRETMPILPGDADPSNPVIRARAMIDVPVAASGSYVIFHVSGDLPFDLGKLPFAVSNPVFLTR